MGEQETSRTVEDQEQPQDAQPSPENAEGDEQVEERGADSPEAKGQERDFDQEVEDAKEEVKALEDDPPEKLEDWPSGRAKYETFGGPEHETSYEEAATSKLGPSDVRFHEDGTVEVDGEEADNPDDYKSDPIPGGPTDPNAPGISGEEKDDRQQEQDEDEGDSDD
jgi:hypothetical protein